MQVTALSVERIRTDGGTQPRAEMNQLVVDEYAASMEGGAAFPPVVVFHDGEGHWLADGFHRVAAARSLQRLSIGAEVRQGTRRDAVLFSVGANASHGLRRTNADKRRAAEVLLADSEWSGWSDREIARRCGVSDRFINSLRPPVTANGSQSERTYTTKHGTQATMNTSRIGAAAKISQEARVMFWETPAADRQEDILRLSRMEPDRQVMVAERIAAGAAPSVKAAERLLLEERRDEAREQAARIGATPFDDRLSLHVCAVSELAALIPAGTVDVIITDPPYPREYIPVYADLARFAAHALKPGGSCLVMIGQSYLPEVLAGLSEHLTYHWALSYLTPGAQSAQVFPRKVNPFWKPVLWMVKGEYAGEWQGDVIRSDVNANDKRFHEWGQSESGIGRLVEGWSKPGEVVCDPFVGGGTLAEVALRLGRRVIAADVAEVQIQTTRARLVGGLN